MDFDTRSRSRRAVLGGVRYRRRDRSSLRARRNWRRVSHRTHGLRDEARRTSRVRGLRRHGLLPPCSGFLDHAGHKRWLGPSRGLAGDHVVGGSTDDDSRWRSLGRGLDLCASGSIDRALDRGEQTRGNEPRLTFSPGENVRRFGVRVIATSALPRSRSSSSSRSLLRSRALLRSAACAGSGRRGGDHRASNSRCPTVRRASRARDAGRATRLR